MSVALIIYAVSAGIAFAVAYCFGRMLDASGHGLWIPAALIAVLWPLLLLVAVAVWSRDRMLGWIES